MKYVGEAIAEIKHVWQSDNLTIPVIGIATFGTVLKHRHAVTALMDKTFDDRKVQQQERAEGLKSQQKQLLVDMQKALEEKTELQDCQERINRLQHELAKAKQDQGNMTLYAGKCVWKERKKERKMEEKVIKLILKAHFFFVVFFFVFFFSK